MKGKIVIISVISLVLSSVLFTNCQKKELFLDEKVQTNLLKSESNDLMKKAKEVAYSYQVPEKVFLEFEESVIFDEKFRLEGAIYDGVEQYFNDKQSDEFWGVFGLSVRDPKSVFVSPAVGPHIFVGYKPKGGGNCKSNTKWICSIYGTLNATAIN